MAPPTSVPLRPPPYPTFSGSSEDSDAAAFTSALYPTPISLQLLQNAPPAVSPHPGALDVLLFRGVLLVAYAAADELIIARGTDLEAIRRLRTPSAQSSPVSAVSFRARDGAVAAAFGSEVVIFEGWSEAAKERRIVYVSNLTEAVLDTQCKDSIVSLSWNAEGNILAAIASKTIVWKLSPEHRPVKYDILAKLSPPSPAIGAISPDGKYIAIASLYARLVRIWQLSFRDSGNLHCTEISVGRSGIAALDWKKRGGGNQALVTTDRDGSLHIWVRTPVQTNIPVHTQLGWEEIARSPHVEHTPAAGAAFLDWGGGGGVADDEGDALATHAAHPLLAEGTAPKPSRCYHWIVRVAGGEVTAWRVRGLDDRPHAEYARLEPGTGETLLGVETNREEFRPPERPLRDVSVSAMRAVAPIPLTVASKYKIGLVKSYAISNGERRLRSPEPPEPPNIAAAFVLAVRNGLPYLARYDICPTSTMPAVCRARVGIGHTSPVADLIMSEQNASVEEGSGSWMASRGRAGDVILWRTNVVTGAWEPVTAVATLPGPHSAVTFAPPKTVSSNLTDLAVFTCDSALGALRLFAFKNLTSRKERLSALDTQFAKEIAVCQSRSRSSDDTVTQLVCLWLNKLNPDGFSSVQCAIFGVRSSGRLVAWRASRRRNDVVTMEPSVIRIAGGRHDFVSSAASNELSDGRQIFVTGGSDGTLYVYSVRELESSANRPGESSDSEDDEDDDGIVWLEELCHLQGSGAQHGHVRNLQILHGGSRILSTQMDGKTTVWSRNTSEGVTWHVELTLEGSISNKGFGSMMNGSIRQESYKDSGASIGYDRDGNFSLVALKRDGVFESYRRALGMPWECLLKQAIVSIEIAAQKQALVHIGKGVLAVANGRGITVVGENRSDSHPLSSVSGAAGYSPSKAILAHILTGGRAWQVIAALDKLHEFVRKVAKKQASETSYGAGKGVIPPPPPLSMLISESKDIPTEYLSQKNVSVTQETTVSPFLPKTGRNLFAELMAKSEANLAAESGSGNKSSSFGLNESNEGESEDLSKLANLLRVVSLAGVTRSEQNVLSAIATASASVRSIFKSLDPCGANFALLAACYMEVSKTEPVPLSIVSNAVHSSSADALVDHFLPAVQAGANPEKIQSKKLWYTARNLGAGWWVSTESGCRKLVERIARSDFNVDRNPDTAALWYIALGRSSTLSALYRMQQNSRMAMFLARNFRDPKNQVAASKNAYALVSKHRLELAVAFFILAGDVKGALSLTRTRLKDEQLAVLLARILDGGKHLPETLRQIAESSESRGDDHCKSIVQWLRGNQEAALLTASKARYPPPGLKIGEADYVLAGSLPAVVHSLSHILALINRPSIRGLGAATDVLQECRLKASRALLGDGSPVASLVVNFDMARSEGQRTQTVREVAQSRKLDISQMTILAAAVDTIKGRAVCLAGAVRSGATDESLQEMLVKDIADLSKSPMGLIKTMQAVQLATFELSKEDEIDAAVAATYAAKEFLGQQETSHAQVTKAMNTAQRNCLRIAVSRALFHVQGALSLLHQPTFSSQRLFELLSKYRVAADLINKRETVFRDLFHRLAVEFKGAVLSLRFTYAFLKGDWPEILLTLRACELLWHAPKSLENIATERDADDKQSVTSASSSWATEAVSVEALRHVASNPAILRISSNLGHIRRCRKTPSMSMVGNSAGAAVAVTDETLGTPTLSIRSDDPYAIVRIHPALSSTLGAASAAYLAAHMASHAAEFANGISKAQQDGSRVNSCLSVSEFVVECDQSFRMIRASEALEQIAEDAMAQWIPLQRFGAEATTGWMGQQDEAAGAFVDLWSTLGCLPEYAPSLSEAATVAAAEMAAAASRAAIEAAEQKDGGRRRRRRRERKGEIVESVAKEGLKLFDTTSADSLHGAYPVRFSSSAQGPWSGKGGHVCLYREDRALFRTLCISGTDPPAVIVATPKGIQEIVPSSYTTMPAGFRSHYMSRRTEQSISADGDERLEALAKDREQDTMEFDQEDQDSFLRTYDGFGEGPYVPLDMDLDREQMNMGSRHSGSGKGRKAVWRHQVQATALASHPLRRRFASGGTDGVVRLWDFADPISLASFREENFGRIADLCFSAYGNTLFAIYSSGHVIIWDDPDVYSSFPRGPRGTRDSRSKHIRAFDNRAASAGAFLDERHTIAVVGDPTAPPSTGHSLRIFDTREPHSSFHASWSAGVNHQGEARCLALLEDRVRVVTGGLDGSLSITDLRTKACVAELPAHTDEVTCLSLEVPRGRALVSGSANGEIKLWDSRTLLQLDTIQDAHSPTRHYWSGNGIGGLVGSYGTEGLALTDRSLISCGGDGMVKVWGPGWCDFDLNVI